MALSQPLFDRMHALADDLRHRLVRLLDGRELTVSELCDVVQAPQSTVSRHLKVLSESGWVDARREGTSRLYRRRANGAEGEELWSLVRERLEDDPAVEKDRYRLQAILSRRGDRSRAFFQEAAERWDALRDELFGSDFGSRALAGLLDERWTVADLGCGTGRFTETLADRCARVIAVDDNPDMLAAARRRLADRSNVEWRPGSLETLPIEDDTLDVAFLMLVLHHLPDPSRVLHEVARTLRPDGRLILVDMQPHDREAYRREMGHVWLGFEAETLRATLSGAGLNPIRVDPLPAEPGARGPALFGAVARRAARNET